MLDKKPRHTDEALLLDVADTIISSHSIGAICNELAILFRRWFDLQAAGFMAFGLGGDTILDIAVRSGEPDKVWRSRIERVVNAEETAQDTMPAGGLTVLPLVHQEKELGKIVVTGHVAIEPATLDKIAAWLSRYALLKTMAAQDPLTGLHNRQHVDELSASVFALCRREQKPVSLMMLDLDHFKTINDDCGHRVGDELLTSFAERLKHQIRGSDLAFRVGGDEFMVIMPDTRLTEASEVARRIHQTAAVVSVCKERPDLRCQVSIGLVENTEGEVWTELQAKADQALCFVKRAGRNNIASFRTDPRQVELLLKAPDGAAQKVISGPLIHDENEGHFLVLDDSQDVRKLITRMLTAISGWKAEAYATADEALAEIRAHPTYYDVVITDLNLTEEDGFQFLEKLGRLDSSISRIVVSGFVTTQNAIHSIQHRVSSIIEKPFDSDDLMRAAVKALAERRRRQLENRYQLTLERECSQRVKELRRTIDTLHHTQWSLIDSFSAMVDLREQGTGLHSRRVARAAVRIATQMGLSPDETEVLQRAALLHDIGKLAVPDAILLKTTSLTEEEMAVVRRHVEYPGALLKNLPFLERELLIIRGHHEAFDGSGYPDGLAGESIPTGARILAVVDAYDAMRMVRSYGKPLSATEAEAELRRGAGSQFDPEIVDVMLTCIPEIENDLVVAAEEERKDPLHEAYCTEPESGR